MRQLVGLVQVLLLFAIVASAYVLHAGLQQPNRSLYKLILHCVMIIISVSFCLRLGTLTLPPH
jgi:hypothetical protein